MVSIIDTSNSADKRCHSVQRPFSGKKDELSFAIVHELHSRFVHFRYNKTEIVARQI